MQNNIQPTLEEVLYNAFLHAIKTLGPKVKGMSCFMSNWKCLEKKG